MQELARDCGRGNVVAVDRPAPRLGLPDDSERLGVDRERRARAVDRVDAAVGHDRRREDRVAQRHPGEEAQRRLHAPLRRVAGVARVELELRPLFVLQGQKKRGEDGYHGFLSSYTTSRSVL